jgi:hypothetical protein
MYNGKIFPTKLRKIMAIIGEILLLGILILAVFNIISHIIFSIGIAIILIVFVFLTLVIKHHEQKQGNKQLTPS